jgi:hypothetical protein
VIFQSFYIIKQSYELAEFYMSKRLEKQKNSEIVKKRINKDLVFNFTKTLNYKFIFSLLAFNMVTMTLIFKALDHSKESAISMHQFKQSILEEIKQLPQPQINISQSSRKYEQLELLKLRNEILEKVGDINLKYANVIEEKQKYYDHVIKEIAKREPASKVLNNSGVIVYSRENINVLKKKQYLSRERLKEDLREQEKDFMKKLDLTTSQDQRLLRKFQDDSKVQLTQLKESQWAALKRLRNDKYLIVNNDY